MFINIKWLDREKFHLIGGWAGVHVNQYLTLAKHKLGLVLPFSLWIDYPFSFNFVILLFYIFLFSMYAFFVINFTLLILNILKINQITMHTLTKFKVSHLIIGIIGVSLSNICFEEFLKFVLRLN